MLDPLLKVLAGILIAGVSSWITVQLSLRRYRTERWWDRKVEAYERVIVAFHHLKKFASEQMSAYVQGDGGPPKERDKELRSKAREARDAILLASDIGEFSLSNKAIDILSEYARESRKSVKAESWPEYLDNEEFLADRYLKDFISEARRDLKR